MASSKASPLRNEGSPVEIGERRLVGRYQTGASAGLDRHVADGHPPGHVERLDRSASIFDNIAGGAGCAEPTNDGQDQVLGCCAQWQVALDADQHAFRWFLDQRLSGEDVLDL